MNKSKKTIAAILAAAQVITTAAIVTVVPAYAAVDNSNSEGSSTSSSTESSSTESSSTGSSSTESSSTNSSSTESSSTGSSSTESSSNTGSSTGDETSSSTSGDDTTSTRPTPSTSGGSSGDVNNYSWDGISETNSDSSSQTEVSVSPTVDGKTVTITQMNNEIKNSNETTVAVDISGTAVSTDTEITAAVRASTAKAVVDTINNGSADKAVEVKVTDDMTLIIKKDTVSTVDSSKPIEITAQKSPETPAVKAEDNSAVRGTAAKSFTASNVGGIETSISVGSSKNGQFANVYKINSEGKSEFVCTSAIENGRAKTRLNGDGKYIVMTGAYSDLKGDADNDGNVSAKDAAEILKQIAKLKDAANNETSVLDFNRDGKVSTQDVVWILKQIAGINN